MRFDILVDLFRVGDFFEQSKFVFWYTRRVPGIRNQSYEDNIKKIVEFSTVRCLLYWGSCVGFRFIFDFKFH